MHHRSSLTGILPVYSLPQRVCHTHMYDRSTIGGSPRRHGYCGFHVMGIGRLVVSPQCNHDDEEADSSSVILLKLRYRSYMTIYVHCRTICPFACSSLQALNYLSYIHGQNARYHVQLSQGRTASTGDQSDWQDNNPSVLLF